MRLVQPAGRLHQQERSTEAGVLQVRIDAADVAADLGADERVGHHGRAALELAVFLREFVRGGDERVRQTRPHDRLHALLVRRIHIAVQQQDSHGLDAFGDQPIARCVHAGFIERNVHVALGGEPFAHFEPQRTLDQRHVLSEKQVVRVGPVDAADLVDVAKALGDQQRGARAGALQHRVDGDRRAMQEQPRLVVAGTGTVYAVRDAIDQIGRGR